jgi:hypothetical protein
VIAVIVLPDINGEDFINGYYLSGKNGELLKSLLVDAGIKINDCYVTDATQPDLKEFIDRKRPGYIIAFGNDALNVLTKKSGIKKYRGQTLPLHESYGFTCNVYPTYSVVDLRNIPTFKRTILADLRNTQKGESDSVSFEFWEA